MGFNAPSFDDTKEFGASGPVPAEGHHDASLTEMVYDVSKKGNDMLVATFMIDNGDDYGAELTEYLVMGHDTGIGESKLKSIAVNARNAEHPEGFEWSSDVSGWEEFAEQFMLDDPLRVGLDLEHELSAELDRGWKNDITEAQYEKFAEQGKKVRRSATIKDYELVEAKADMPASPNSTEPPKKEDDFSAPEFSGDGAPGDDFEEDDGLPF